MKNYTQKCELTETASFQPFAGKSGLLKSLARFLKELETGAEATTIVIQTILSQHPGWFIQMLQPISMNSFGNSVSKVDRKNNDLYKSISLGHVDAVRTILEISKSDDTVYDKEEGTPLLNIAAIAKKSRIMALLLEYGASQWRKCEASSEFFVAAFESVTIPDLQSV